MASSRRFGPKNKGDGCHEITTRVYVDYTRSQLSKRLIYVDRIRAFFIIVIPVGVAH